MEIKDQNVLRWIEVARTHSQELKLSRPFHVLMGEAVDAAREFEANFEPKIDPATQKVERRGLNSVNTAGHERLPATSGEELHSIQKACQHAQSQYVFVSGAVAQHDLMAKGRFLLSEITAVLDYYLDDGVEDENDAAFASVKEEHADDPQSADALASALDDYVGLAKPFEAELDGLAGFEVEYLTEATTTAVQLRLKPATAQGLAEEAAEWIALRNQLTNLLRDRVREINRAGKLVFRDRPEIARKFASAYERRRRAEARRRAKKAAEAAGNSGVPTT